MHSIVTGASGFLGTALCRELLQQGGTVTAVIRPGSKKREKLESLKEENREYLKKFRILEIELEKVQELWQVYQIQADVFYHLAWNGSIGDARNNFDTQYTNIKYTSDAVQTAKLCNCWKFAGAGSQAEYGVVRGKAAEDQTIPNPFMVYGAAKLAACQMAQILAKELDIQFVWPRIYSIYGPGENPETLVSYVVDTLKKGDVPQITACENMWNYMYISDCARALRILGETRDVEGIYHVASNDSRPLKEFIMQIRDIVLPKAELRFGQKQADPKRTFWMEPDIEKLTGIGFQSRVRFEDGIRQILTYSKQENG